MQLLIVIKVLVCAALVRANNVNTATGKDECSGAPRLNETCRDGAGICYFRAGLFGIYGHMGCIAQCGTPPNPPNTVPLNLTGLPVNSTLEGASFTYECAPGFSAPDCAQFEIVCTYDGEWSPIGFECVPDCGPFVVADYFDNAELQTSCGQNEGDTVTVTCADGYAPTGDLIAQCGSDGNWTGSGGTCVRDCGAPPVVPGTTSNGTSTVAGAVTTYECCNGDSGFEITCDGATGQWSAVGSCPAACPPPEAVDGACYDVADLLEGTVATYTCNGGSGVTFNITCQADGTWSDPTGECPADCGTPEAVTGTTRFFTNTFAGEEAEYQCCNSNDTFTIVCDEEGNWNATGTCPADCGIPPFVDHATVSYTSTLEGAQASYACCYANITLTSTCGNDGIWSTPGTCPAAITCDDDDLPEVADTTGDTKGDLDDDGVSAVGTVVTYYCEFGEDVESVCNENGEWSAAACPEEGTKCNDTERPTVADSSDDYSDGGNNGTSPVGTVITYTCQYGGDTVQSVCTEYGNWSDAACPPAPVCCGFPWIDYAAENDHDGSDTSPAGTVVAVTCDDGSAINVTCEASGQWSDDTCPEPVCTDPGSIPYSTGNNFAGPSAAIGDTVVYTCNNEFEAISTCLADGTWSEAACSPKCCPPEQAEGFVGPEYNSTNNGDQAVYTCNGSPVIVFCVAGTWTPPGMCVPPGACELPPEFGNVAYNITYTGLNEGDNATYTCANTAILVNGSSIEVLTCDGTNWGTLTIQCATVLDTCTVEEMETGRSSDNQGNRFGDCCYYPTQSSDTIGGTISYCRDEPTPKNDTTFDVATAQNALEAEWLRLYAETVLQADRWWTFLICENGEWEDASTGEVAPYLRPDLTPGGTCTEGYCGVLMTDDDVWVEKPCTLPKHKQKGICKICFD